MRPTDPKLAAAYDRYHKGRYMAQKDGPFGPGSCHCCANGGAFAGRPAPKGAK